VHFSCISLLFGRLSKEVASTTTSLLERTNRELRRKFRQACCFSSRRGAEVAIYLQVQRLHARWTKTSWAHTARALALAFY
jgi:transposase-like protein